MSALKSFFARRTQDAGRDGIVFDNDRSVYEPVALDISDGRRPYHVGNKVVMADKLFHDYVSQRSPVVKFVLERMLDFRLCSLIACNLAKEYFSAYGADFVRDSRELASVLGLELLRMPTGRLADTGHHGSLALPAKYRGFGYPINSPSHVGQLFQINLCSFAESNPRLAVVDWQQGAFRVVKGLKHIGTDGRWEILEIDRSTTDDMTALLLNERKSEVEVEIAHLQPDGSMKIVYRFSNMESNLEYGRKNPVSLT